MKHQVCTFLLLVSFALCADNIVADKSQRIGRFSYEDSFDEKLVETVLKNSSAVVKKNIQRLLYQSHDEDALGQRLLLLGGVNNASTNAIAKAIALRCGYEYYVVEAAALLREYREGRQMLLSEIRPIIKQGKPVAIIITGLPEMADYSGLLASTLWLLIDQCERYPDVLIIATSGFKKKHLSQEVKDCFRGNIISIELDQVAQKHIENMVAQKMSWIAKYKVASLVVAGFTCCALATVCMFTQTLFAVVQMQKQQENEKKLLEKKIVNLSNEMSLIAEENNAQNKLIQSQQCDMQKKLIELKKESVELQEQAYRREKAEAGRREEEAREAEKKAKKAAEDDENNPMSLNYWSDEDDDDFGD